MKCVRAFAIGSCALPGGPILSYVVGPALLTLLELTF